MADAYVRVLADPVGRALARGKSVLLLGARQVGKTTLARRLGADLEVSLMQTDARQRYEREPGALRREVEARAAGRARPLLVLLDEVQKVPALLDDVQDLVDRQVAQFVLIGSSARRLRRGAAINLLPGRVVLMHMDPLSLLEDQQSGLELRLSDGGLPGIVRLADAGARELDLRAYAETYLEQEIRAEAAARNLGAFARFLELAAIESGKVVNFSRVAADVGVAHTTIKGYYEVLHDCLMLERFEPLLAAASRRRLTRASKYVVFDLGVRRACAREGRRAPLEQRGRLLEQWVGLELVRLCRALLPTARVRFWRDPAGPEVDWVLEAHGHLLPIEVKWTDRPRPNDARHLATFLREYPGARRGLVVCRAAHPSLLAPTVTAIPWHTLHESVAAFAQAVVAAG